MYILETMTYGRNGIETKRLPFIDFGDLIECYNETAFIEICKNPYGSTLTIDNNEEEVIKDEGLKIIRQLVIRNKDKVKKYTIIWCGPKVKIKLDDIMVVYRKH